MFPMDYFGHDTQPSSKRDPTDIAKLPQTTAHGAVGHIPSRQSDRSFQHNEVMLCSKCERYRMLRIEMGWRASSSAHMYGTGMTQ